jgi:hypothetical protein
MGKIEKRQIYMRDYTPICATYVGNREIEDKVWE